ncbi:hypothetical protein [Spirosoma sordidisoli]|uniref:Uncharacterized protein n=1 Tax=Spirosoma sordidisoli TaxID=2502893 RepID=A0A4Q2UMR1_9BACT|nr:hypothetical protein [Spirosoma sordidisoli]RYC70072.1 hypothetical protein EQG79_09380 [Spirosoma sordidisoli]
MKQVMLLLLTWITTNVSILDEPIFKVTRTFTDGQIKQVQQQVLQEYGIKAEVKVISRNNKGEITSLECVRYDKLGTRKGSCESDKFGVLVITRTGCKIADLGYEDQI